MTNVKYPSLLKAFLDHPYSEATCFLCAKELNEKNSTQEHVIPKWMQRRYDLWNQQLFLPNRTCLRYRQLTVPCCKECNGRFGELEGRVKRAVDAGATAVKQFSQFHLFQWLSKIFLGMYYKDIFLSADRTNSELGGIGTTDHLKDFSLLHFWLQAAIKHSESEFIPGSIFIVPTSISSDRRDNFDFLDNWLSGCLAVRCDTVGIVVQFLDNGIHKRAMSDLIKIFEGHEHDHLQFREFCSKIFYKASLLDFVNVIEVIPRSSGGITAQLMWKAPVHGNSLFKEWDPRVFAKILSFYTSIPFEQLFVPPNKVRTWCPWDADEIPKQPTESDK